MRSARVENRVHGAPDAALREDHSGLRKDNNAENFAILR